MSKRKKEEYEIGTGLFVTIIALIVLVIGSILFFAVPFPYTATEHRISTVPYQVTETYVEWINSANCDNDRTCYCQHNSWLGFGACDSCRCNRERTITKYKEVTEDVKVTNKATLFQMATKKVDYYYEVR